MLTAKGCNKRHVSCKSRPKYLPQFNLERNNPPLTLVIRTQYIAG